MDIQPGPYACTASSLPRPRRQLCSQPRPYTGIGPLEVLRVALMRGDLDDLRNDLARALRRNDIAPSVLEGLLCGLQGVGIRLDGARQALRVSSPETAPAVAHAGGPTNGGGGTESAAVGRCETFGCGDEDATATSAGPSGLVAMSSEQQAEKSQTPCVRSCVSQRDAVVGATCISSEQAPCRSLQDRVPFCTAGLGANGPSEASVHSVNDEGLRPQIFVSPEPPGKRVILDGRFGATEKENTGICTNTSSNPILNVHPTGSSHDAVAERGTATSKGKSKKPARRKRSGGARWTRTR